MKAFSRLVRITATCTALGCASASATPVTIDASPSGSFHRHFTNQQGLQNFLVQFSLAETTALTGFEIFTRSSQASIGKAVTVRIRNDAAGSPAISNLFEFGDVIDSVNPFNSNNVIAGISLDGVMLSAGTYWIGVSGATSSLDWSTYNHGFVGPDDQRILLGNIVQGKPSVYDLAYRIHGTTVSAVPEPTTMALFALGLTALGFARRRRVP